MVRPVLLAALPLVCACAADHGESARGDLTSGQLTILDAATSIGDDCRFQILDAAIKELLPDQP